MQEMRSSEVACKFEQRREEFIFVCFDLFTGAIDLGSDYPKLKENSPQTTRTSQGGNNIFMTTNEVEITA